jgi:hypothetical protein
VPGSKFAIELIQGSDAARVEIGQALPDRRQGRVPHIVRGVPILPADENIIHPGKIPGLLELLIDEALEGSKIVGSVDGHGFSLFTSHPF